MTRQFRGNKNNSVRRAELKLCAEVYTSFPSFQVVFCTFGGPFWTPGAPFSMDFGSWGLHFQALGPSRLQGWPSFSVLGAVWARRLLFRTRLGGPGYQNGPEKEYEITKVWSNTSCFRKRFSIDFRTDLLSNFITFRGAPNSENVTNTLYCRLKTKVPPPAQETDFSRKWKPK